MQTVDNTNEPNDSKELIADDSSLAANVSDNGTASRINLEIAPEHQHYADAILAMDPLNVPSANAVFGFGSPAPQLTVEALPKEQRAAVIRQLNALGDIPPEQRAAREDQLVAAQVRAQRNSIFVKCGLGDDATPYHLECAAIANEVADLMREYKTYQDALEEVTHHDTATDPETGETVAIPVYAVTGQREAAYRGELRKIMGRIRSLVNEDGTPGFDAVRRSRIALVEAVNRQVERDLQISEEAEAQRMAVDMNREKRIKARAETIARIKGTDR